MAKFIEVHQVTYEGDSEPNLMLLNVGMVKQFRVANKTGSLAWLEDESRIFMVESLDKIKELLRES